MTRPDAINAGPGAALLHLLRGNAPEAREAWPAILALALRHGVGPLLHRRLQAGGALTGVPIPVARRLDEERRATALENLRNYGELQRIARGLDEAGVPVLPLKGLHLAELVYQDISLRPMSDMDILVPRTRVADAVAALRRLGYGRDDAQAPAAEALLRRKCNIGLAHERLDIWLEVHWTLDESHNVFDDPAPEIWDHATRGRLGGADVRLMSPAFLLLHVCAHLACNHAFSFSLRGLCDIVEILKAHPDLDWNAVVAHGLRHGWTRGIAAGLRLARDHLGAPVPPEAMAALGGDTLDTAMLEEAMVQLLGTTAIPEELATAPNLLAFSGAREPWRKAALLWRRIFIPRAELAMLYGLPTDSPRLILYYVRRLLDLLRRYTAGAWALNVADPVLAETAERHVRLTRWIRATGARPD